MSKFYRFVGRTGIYFIALVLSSATVGFSQSIQQMSGSMADSVVSDARQKSEIDPRVLVHNRLGLLFSKVRQDEENGIKTWQHAVDLEELGQLFLHTGAIGEGKICLQSAPWVMHKAQDKPANGELLVTDSLFAYGQALIMDDYAESPGDRRSDFVRADSVLGTAYNRVTFERRSPEIRATVLSVQADAQLKAAAATESWSPAGKILFRRYAQESIESAHIGLSILASRRGNDDIALQAKLYSELADAQVEANTVSDHHWWDGILSLLAKFIGMRGAALNNYKQSVDLWTAYNADDPSMPSDERARAAQIRDRQLLSTLMSYQQLLQRRGYAADARDALDEARRLSQAHQEWRQPMVTR